MMYILMTQALQGHRSYTYISRYNFEKKNLIWFFLSHLGAIMLCARHRSRKRGLPFRACITYARSNGNRNQRLRNHSGERYVRLTCYSPLKSFAHREHGQYFTGLSHNRYFTIINCLSPSYYDRYPFKQCKRKFYFNCKKNCGRQ